MKKYIAFLTCFITFISCTEKSKEIKENKVEPEKTEPLSMGDMPNKNTVYDTIYTTNTTDNTKLINQLQQKLNAVHFSFEEREQRGGFTYNNCEENRIEVISGNGVREYYVKSTKPQKVGGSNYYPDFIVVVYEFKTNEIAQQNFDKLQKALNSAGRFCNGKSPEKLVINKNEVFHLGTRAEMFREYTEKYGEMIQKF